ncbi:protein lifeguard 1-like [Hermetia illucens]|uniref:protein lifeguard 1-like n=1 Tax=Hermetia illucens TaxID=343691 RepID=UPI0018CC461E|nr:protein lifeguard 1-like [Hermetia illucens]
MAIGITAAVCLALTLFAWQSCCDFTLYGGILLAALVIFFIAGIIMIFIRSRIATIVYTSVGVLIFSAYLVYDTQLIIGGKHKHKTNPEEYIFAALSLYLDIVLIFVYLLSLIGAVNRFSES